MTSIKTKVYKKLSKDFFAEWEKIWENSPHGHFFNSPKWFLTCKKTFKIKSFLIFAVYHQGELKAVLPLKKARRFGIPVYASCGGRYLEKSTLLMAEKNLSLLAGLFSEIEKYGNIFLSEADAVLAQNVGKIKPQSLISTISINPYIDLSDNPCRYLVKKQKGRILNRMKRFSPRLTHGHYSGNFHKHLKTVFEVEEKSAKRRSGRDLFSDSTAQKLFSNLIKDAPEHILIDILYYQGKPVVTMFGLTHKGKYLGFHTSYLEEFRNLLPGKILLHKMIYKLYRDGFKWFDFSRGHNALKKEFTPCFQLQYDVYYSKNAFTRFWWEGINKLRRFKASLTKHKESLDGNFLFKKYQSVWYQETQFIHVLN
jgi:CelD/BcsL family acetyltransferase involved in cellulose biosynthesis